MKLLRVGEVGNEIPATLDDKGIIRDLSDHINDFSAESLNFDNLNNLKKLDLKNLKEIDENIRVGSCVKKPGNFFAIGLNYKAHAEETGAEAPFGGIKQTGYGREGGSMAIKDYLNIKYTHLGIKG